MSKPYQRKDGMWVASIENGWTAKGTRARITVSARTKAACERRLRDKILEVESGETGTSARATVKAWADQWLAMKERDLRPKAYNAARTYVRVWIVPTIGRKRLTALSPVDARAVTAGLVKAGRSPATANGAHRTLLNMLRDAVREGHAIPQAVLLSKAPAVPISDRQPLTIPEALACLAVAAELPHGTRWVFALLHGMRQGECLGTTWDAINFDTGEMVVEWQLQKLNYIDPKDKSKGFRVPPHLEVRHLRGAFHLTRPKSRAGLRVVPLVPAVLNSLERWRGVTPGNEWGLLWTTNGRPVLHADDLAEWHSIQERAKVRHPSGRYYHVHECRNLTATQLRDADVDPLVITSLLGHSDIATSQAYMRVDRPARLEALEKVAGVLGIG